MELDGAILGRDPPNKLDALRLEDVQLPDVDVRPRQARQALGAGGRRVGADVRVGPAGLVGAQERRPAGHVGVVVPHRERLDGGDGRVVAVVEHRVDEHKAGGRWREGAVARHEGHAGGDAAARGLAEEGDAGGVDVQGGGVRVEVQEGGVDVFGGGRVGVFGGFAVVDAEGGDAVAGDGGGDGFGQQGWTAGYHAAAVGVEDGGRGAGGGGVGAEVGVEDGDLAAVVGRNGKGFLDETFWGMQVFEDQSEEFGHVLATGSNVVYLGDGSRRQEWEQRLYSRAPARIECKRHVV